MQTPFEGRAFHRLKATYSTIATEIVGESNLHVTIEVQGRKDLILEKAFVRVSRNVDGTLTVEYPTWEGAP